MERSERPVASTVHKAIVIVHVRPPGPKLIHPVVAKDIRGLVGVIVGKGLDEVKVF